MSSPFRAPHSPIPGDRLLDVDAALVTAKLDRQPFTIRHSLSNHPLFSLDRLIELARSLPANSVEYNDARIAVDMNGRPAPRTGLSAEETIKRIDETGSWVALKNVEQDLEYRILLDQCLDEIREFSEAVAPGMCKREGFIFISSPQSVTPYHLDPEYNFLLQIRGDKTMSVFDPRDRSILPEIELEKCLFGGSRNMAFRDEYQKRASLFDLQPGDGLHVPVMAPHWVKTGDQASVSFSITFRTPASDRRAIIYDVNRRLRKIGLDPSPFDQSQIRDSAKFYSYRALRRALWSARACSRFLISGWVS